MSTARVDELIPELEDLAATAKSAHDLMKSVVSLLRDRLHKYNWVGFYMIEKNDDGELLVLGPFQGGATPHTRIPLHKGICGAAASSGKTVIVDDVHSDSRYLACSIETKSEIVVPVFVNGNVVGELDIDSHYPAAFGPEDQRLCEHAASLVGRYLEKHK